MAKINSRAKGARGELELAAVLKEYGYEARRGQQFSGGSDSPDVVTDLPGIHIECKRVEAGNLYNWLEQAQRDAKGKTPVVMHRRTRKDWVCILTLEDFLKLTLTLGA
jgi:Holliday junction resolvase